MARQDLATEPQTSPSHGSANVVVADWLHAWVLTVIGGGACGVVAFGYFSAVYFIVAIPIGMILGALLGLPLGLILGWLFRRYASPPVDASRFARVVARVGMAIALLINIPTNAQMFFEQRSAPMSGDEIAIMGTAAAVCVLFAALIGHECGRALAVSHLGRLKIAGPTRSPLRRWFRSAIRGDNA